MQATDPSLISRSCAHREITSTVGNLIEDIDQTVTGFPSNVDAGVGEERKKEVDASYT